MGFNSAFKGLKDEFIPITLWNPKIRYLIYNSPHLVSYPDLADSNPYHVALLSLIFHHILPFPPTSYTLILRSGLLVGYLSVIRFYLQNMF